MTKSIPIKLRRPVGSYAPLKANECSLNSRGRLVLPARAREELGGARVRFEPVDEADRLVARVLPTEDEDDSVPLVEIGAHGTSSLSFTATGLLAWAGAEAPPAGLGTARWSGVLWPTRAEAEARGPHLILDLRGLPRAVKELRAGGRKSRPKPVSRPPLTPAQRKIVRLLARGRTVKQSAEDLGIAVSTLHVQMKRCRERLGVKTNGEVVERAKELGYIKPTKRRAQKR